MTELGEQGLRIVEAIRQNAESRRLASEYDCFSDEQWEKVLGLLGNDLRRKNHGIDFVAPQYPEAGQEPKIAFYLETERMNWGETEDRPLSAAILHNHLDPADKDELRRMIQALQNTINVLKAAQARHHR